MTDVLSWTIIAASTDGAAAWLSLVCDHDGLDVIVRVDHYLSQTVSVQYRFDTDQASIVEDWMASDRAAVAPDAVVPRLTARATTAKKLVIRIDGATYTFDLEGSLRTGRSAPLGPSDRRATGDSLTTFVSAYQKLPCSRNARQARESQSIDTEAEATLTADYLRNAAQQVQRRWQRPERSPEFDAEISFLGRRDGSMTDLRFVRRSGDFAFDLAAQGAVEEAGRVKSFGALPAGWTSDTLYVHLHFSGGTGLVSDIGETDRELESTSIGDQSFVAADHVYLEAVVDERPERLSGPKVQYPELLRQAGVHGRVIVEAVIDTTGRAIPSSVRVTKTPHPGFDQPAKNLVLQSLFRPGRVSGRAVNVLVSLAVEFALGAREGSYVTPAELLGLFVPPVCATGPFTVHFSVEVDGRVSRIDVDPLPTDDGCWRKLLASMHAYRFRPARLSDGRPVASVYTVAVSR